MFELFLIAASFCTSPVDKSANSPFDLDSQQAAPQVVLSIEEISKGKLVEKVVTAKTPSQSYALYVPSNYTPERKWPILYAFDPGARGSLAISRFQEAAEKYGWIVAGSNNSRNGSARESLEAFAAIWDDTHQRFSIDDRRVYTTGFSGGARMAVMAAHLCGDCIAGVIASGGGLYQGLAPSAKLRFAFFGAVGVDDFNFPELKGLEDVFEKSGVTHRIEVFEGRHEWAPAAVASEAIEWMEIQAMKAGRREQDSRLTEVLWQQKLAQAKALEESQQAYEAYRVYSVLADGFRNLRDVSEAESKALKLKDSREIKASVRDQRHQISKQTEIESQIASLILERELATDNFAAGYRLKRKLDEIQKSAKAEMDSGERRVARRVVAGLFVSHYEAGIDLLQRQKNYRRAATSFEIAVTVAPDRPYASFHLACAYALEGERKKSLQALRNAVEKGFSDSSAIAEARALDSLRAEPEYLEIIKTLEQKTVK